LSWGFYAHKSINKYALWVDAGQSDLMKLKNIVDTDKPQKKIK